MLIKTIQCCHIDTMLPTQISCPAQKKRLPERTLYLGCPAQLGISTFAGCPAQKMLPALVVHFSTQLVVQQKQKPTEFCDDGEPQVCHFFFLADLHWAADEHWSLHFKNWRQPLILRPIQKMRPVEDSLSGLPRPAGRSQPLLGAQPRKISQHLYIPTQLVVQQKMAYKQSPKMWEFLIKPKTEFFLSDLLIKKS